MSKVTSDGPVKKMGGSDKLVGSDGEGRAHQVFRVDISGRGPELECCSSNRFLRVGAQRNGGRYLKYPKQACQHRLQHRLIHKTCLRGSAIRCSEVRPFTDMVAYDGA